MNILHAKFITVPNGTNTDIVRPADWNSGHLGALTILGNTNGASTWSGSNLQLSGGANMTLRLDGGTLEFSGAAGGAGGGGLGGISAGAEQATTGTVVFSNANGVSFGLQNSTLTASHNGLTTAALSNHSHGSPQLNLTNLSGTTQSNSAGLTLSLSAAASHAQQTGISGLGANGGTATSGTVLFSNSNNVSFGYNAGTITATATWPAQSNQTVGLYAVGNTTQNSSTTLDARSVSVNGAGVASVGFSNGSMLVSVPSGGGAGDGYNIVGVNGNSVGSAATLQLSNGNNVSFGLAGSTITATASFNQSVQTQGMVSLNGQTGALSLATGSSLSSSVNGLSTTLGLASNITTALQPAGAYLTTARASNDALGLNTALTAGPLAWTANSSGLSLNAGGAAGTSSGFGGNSISGSMTHNSAGLNLSLSHPAWLTTAALSNHAHAFSADASSTFQTLSFQNSNGVSFSNNAGAVRITHGLQYTSNTSEIITGRAGTGTTFAGANISGSMTNNTAGLNLSLSVAAPGGGGGVALYDGANSITSGTARFSNANGISVGINGQTITLSHNGLTTAALSNHSHGNPSLQLTNLSGTTGSNSAGFTLSLSAAAPGAAAEANWFHLIGNTSNASTASGSTISLSAGNNVTLAGSNGSIIKIEAAAGGGGEAATFWWPFNEGVNVMGQHGNGTLHFIPIPTPAVGQNVQFDRIGMPINFSNATNSTGSVTLSLWMGFYTRTGSSISRVHSTSHTVSLAFAGTNNSQVGMRLVTFPWTTTVLDNRYYVGIVSRQSTSGNNCSLSQVLVSNLATNFSGFWDQATNRSYQWPLGMGVLSASTTALPGSVAFSQLDGTNSAVARPPSWFAISGTA